MAHYALTMICKPVSLGNQPERDSGCAWEGTNV